MVVITVSIGVKKKKKPLTAGGNYSSFGRWCGAQDHFCNALFFLFHRTKMHTGMK